MRFEKTDQCSEQARFARSGAKLVCPDSGQLDEPLRPSGITKGYGKGAKGKLEGIIWLQRAHDLELRLKT